MSYIMLTLSQETIVMQYFFQIDEWQSSSATTELYQHSIGCLA